MKNCSSQDLEHFCQRNNDDSHSANYMNTTSNLAFESKKDVLFSNI